jgi:PAS domain S-box-containing protein
VFGSGGAIIGSQGILLDVTERKRAEAELAREHDLLRMLLDYCPAPIYFKDLQSRLVKLSQSEAKNLMRVALSRHCAEHPDETGDKLPPHLTSLERFHKHVIGKSDSDIYGPERAAEFRKAEEEIIRTGQPISGNLEKTVCPDGKVIWFVTTKAPWRDNKGEIIGTFGISTDMTDIKEAEARLDSERALLGSLLDNSPDHIYFKDLQSRFIKVSRKHAEQFGFHNPDEIFGKTDFDFFDKTHAEPAFQEEQEIIRTGEPLIGKVQNKMTKDGRTSWALLSKLPLRDKAGNIIGTFGISKDITAMKEAQAKLDAERDLVRCLLDSSPDQIYFKDLQSRFLKSSKAQAEHFGVKHPDELVGRSDSDFFDEAHARPALEDEQEIIRTGVPMIGKVEKEVSKDGHVTWCITSKLPLRDNAGKIIGTFGISRDITAMKEAEAKLDAERDLVRCLLEASHDHIYFKDLESRFIKTSQSKANHIGRKHPDEFVGKTDFDLFDEAHARPAFEDEQKIIRTGAPIIGKVEKEVFKDGKVSWALTTKMPLRDKTGKIIGTFGISKDITAMKEAEAKLELLHRQLLEASRQAGMAEVATGVLHNVGNVLNSVNVGASMLADRLRKSKVSSVGRVAAMMKEHEQNLGEFVTSDPKGRLLPSFLAQLADHLAAEQVTALEELAGLEKNIDHIKDIVAMQQNYAKVSGVTQTIKVVDLVDDALHMNDHALIRHDVKLVRDYDPSVQEITVDNHKVMQILINLVRNAKYACDDSGLPEKRMVVRVAKEGGRVKISVIDNGIGIAPENLTRVFNHGFTTRKEGHGFGLHSGALAAKELGGSLTVQSDGVGRGATFTLELPLQPPTPAS